jgi:hypothetical protein
MYRHFGPDFDRFALTPHKYLFAGPGVVLIDDKEENVNRFKIGPGGRPTGAAGILFPRHNNSLYPFAVDPVRRVKMMISHLKEGF